MNSSLVTEFGSSASRLVVTKIEYLQQNHFARFYSLDVAERSSYVNHAAYVAKTSSGRENRRLAGFSSLPGSGGHAGGKQ